MINKNATAIIILTGLMITIFCFIDISEGLEKKPNEEVKWLQKVNQLRLIIL